MNIDLKHEYTRVANINQIAKFFLHLYIFSSFSFRIQMKHCRYLLHAYLVHLKTKSPPPSPTTQELTHTPPDRDLPPHKRMHCILPTPCNQVLHSTAATFCESLDCECSSVRNSDISLNIITQMIQNCQVHLRDIVLQMLLASPNL